MLRSIGLCIGLFLGGFLASNASAAVINPDNYTIYYGDLNADGASDYYFAQKPLMLVLHGDIVITLPIKRNDHFAIYRSGDVYTNAQTFALTEAEIAQRLTAGTLRLAVLNSDFFLWEGNGENYALLRGADASAPAVFLKSQANTVLPTAVNYPVATYPQISNRNYQLAITDINNDGHMDIVLGSGDINSSQEQTAYLAGTNGIPSTYFEVTPAAIEPSLPIDSGSGIKYHVGTVGGQFRVDESGAATYNIPIQLPEGVAGVTPQVALNYSSQAGVGLLGKGWSLSAHSGISRCRKTLSQDNDVKPITWTNQDRFCLDGQRLIVVSGTYGAVNSQYKTEIDSYARITALGGTAGHPSYFKVEGKDGSVSYYGRTNNAKIYGSGSAIATTTLTWALSRFEDNVGNGIDYVYTGDASTGHRLDYISYAYSTTSKNPSTIPQSSERNAEVKFFYETGTASSAYVAGYEFNNTKRLSRIEIANNGQEVRRYNLTYMPTTTSNVRYQNNIDRLERVTECKGASDCLAPVTFSWGGGSYLIFNSPIQAIDFPDPSDDKYLLNNTFADVTGNGKQDLIYLMYEKYRGDANNQNKADLAVRIKYADTNLSSLIFMSLVSDYKKINIATIDYNADGRQDLALYDGTKWKIYLSTPRADGTWRIDNGSNGIIIDTGLTNSDTSFIDINSDGLADAVTGTSYRLLERNNQPISSSQAYSFSATVKNLSWGSDTNYTELSEPWGGVSGCTPLPPTKKILPTKAADFNGDGVVDFLADYVQNASCYVPAPGDNPRPIYRTHTYALIWVNDTLVNYGGAKIPSTEIYPVDLNGDGLTDIIYATGMGGYSYRINNGNGFNSAVSWLTLPTYSSGPKAAPQFMDVNGDGATDAVWNDRNVGKLYVQLWGSTSKFSLRNVTNGEKDSHLLMDVSGDGILDYLKVTSSSMSGQNGAWAFAGEPYCLPYYNPTVTSSQSSCTMVTPDIPVPSSQQNNAIYSIANGLGAITKINYGTLSNSGRYSATNVDLTVTTATYPTGCYSTSYPCPPTYTTSVADPGKFYERLNGGWDLPPNSQTFIPDNINKGKPVLEVNGAIQIVTSVESSAPAAGTAPGAVNQNALSEVDYYYAEAKMQASGRGFLGFGKLKTVDRQTEVTTVTNYRQDFPFIGSPLSTTVYKNNASSAVVLSNAINTWKFKEVPGTDGTSKLYQIKLEKSEEKSFDYNDGALLQTAITDSLYDDYGNLTDSTVVTSGKKVDGSATSLTKVTDNVYGSTVDEQRLGRLLSTTVITTRDNEPSQTRSSSFTYYDAGDSKGAQYLLKTEKVNSANLVTTTTIYEYDVFGNKAKVITEVDANNKRSVTYNYGTTGRYLLSTTNDLNQSATIDARDVFGNIKTATDINGIESKVFYDAMGGEYLRKDSTGAWSRTDSQYCGSTITCPTGASYRVYKRVAGGGKAYEYYDMLGRVIRSSKVSFDGTLTHVDTEYDNLSRTKRQSVPFTGETAQYWTENTYDNLGRVTEVKAPDGSVSTSTYSGNTTVVTNALSQTRTEYRNGLGQLVKVKDHLNGTIEYDYDLNGNLTKAKTTADGTSVSVRICYDELGRKVAMHDPDKGGFKGNAALTCAQVAGANPKAIGWWYYSYNTYGELVEQTDPKGQRTKNYYDKMGRMIGRIDYLSSGALEGFTQWFYDSGLAGMYSNDVNGLRANEINGKLKAVVMNTASGQTTSQAEQFITDRAASCTENSSSCHKTLYYFDFETHQLSETWVYYPGSNQPYKTYTYYDDFGRVYRQYDALNGVIKDINGSSLDSGVQTHYNLNGYVHKTTDIATGLTLQATQSVNVLGQVTQELRGNGVTTKNTYDIRTGLMTNQQAGIGGIFNVQNITYQWDTVGNLKFRQNQSPLKTGGNKNLLETFQYDGLNRLVNTLTNYQKPAAPYTCYNTEGAVRDIVYYGNGNIKCKREVGEYTYGTNAGPHAVTNAGGKAYTYDNNGNMLAGDNRYFEYTSYDLVSKIGKGSPGATGDYAKFKYGPDRSRWQREDKKGSSITTTTYLGNVERIEVAGSPVIEWKRYVNGVIYTYSTNNYALQNSSRSYVYSDHLGSVDVITNETGSIKQSLSFDPWGARRNGENWVSSFSIGELTLAGFTQPVTNRGFTGHEMVDDMGIIHMNGRIYDAKLARFLQADPFIQAATNTQSYNRYSYLWNNPLNATDPSGFFLNHLKKAFRGLIKFAVKIFGPELVNFVGNVVFSYLGGALGAAFWAYNFSRAMGASSSAAFKSGASSFVTAMVPGGSGVKGFIVRGVVGGISSVIMDGNFGHGFLSAGISGAIGSSGNWFADLAVKSIVGGAISEMTGGKFANGAQSAAISFVIQSGFHKLTAGGKPEPEPEQKPAQSGASATCNPINIATGEKYLTMVDYKAEGASQMTFVRHYSSYAHEKSSLGIGWRSNFERKLEVSRIGNFEYSVVAIRHQGDAMVFNREDDESSGKTHWVGAKNHYEALRKTETGWELQLTDNTREIYDEAGRLVKIQQIDGYEQTLVYGNQGTVKNVLLSVKDNFGQQLKFAYDLQSRMTKMIATDGAVTRYEYDDFDNLNKVISPDDSVENPWDNAYVVYDYTDTRFVHAITGIRNSQGQRIHSMDYDEQGRAILSALGDDAERVDMVFSQGESNTKHTLVKNSLGKNTSYTFNEQNKPLAVEGHPTASCIGSNQGYEYNDQGQLISKTDWNGSVTHYEYNARGLETLRVESVGTAQERRIETEWHTQWRLPVSISAAGLVVELDYNRKGQLIRRAERDTSVQLNGLQQFFNQYPEREWNYQYNEQGLLVAVDGARTDVADITRFEYDNKGNRTAVTNALNHRSEVLAVNDRGLPLQVRDANGVITELAYNTRGWLVSKTLKTEEGDATTEYHYSGISDYNDKGIVSSISLPNGDEISYEYDAARRLIAQSNKAGERMEYTLDLEGNRTEQRIYAADGTLAHSQRQVFDELSRLLQSIGADGNSIRFGYDKAGNRISTTDGLGNQTTYAYDALNRLMATTDALDGVVNQTWDAADRITSITDQRGLTTQYRYNGFGNKVAQISPDTGETHYGYDEAGNLISKRDARGVVTQYQYDVLNRVTDIIYPAANDENIHYTYDNQQQGNKGTGRIATITDASGQQAYGYNANGQIDEQLYQIANTRYSMAYDYNLAGQLLTQEYPSGRTVSYHYDVQGRLAQLETSYNSKTQTVVNNLGYQPFGGVSEIGYGNGVELSIQRDQNYRIRNQRVMSVAANDAIYEREYDYDANSNIVAIADRKKPAASQVFAYDALSRLTTATGSYGNISYGYDAVGNRIEREQNGKLEAYTYADTSNRLLSVISEAEQGQLQTRNLGYDAVGNIISDSAVANSKVLGFNNNNRLEQVAVSNVLANTTTTADYEYNAKGQRVIKRVNGKVIHFHYDTENRLVAETRETGEPIREYIYAAGQRLAMVDYSNNADGAVYYMVNDHLGTPQLLLDTDQQVVWSVDQSPFGEVTTQGNVEQPLRFPGQYADVETGYSYNYFRDYDPTLGRYIESDPIGLEAGVNTFGYVMGSPIRFFDPFGLDQVGHSTFTTYGEAYNTAHRRTMADSRGDGQTRFSVVYREKTWWGFGRDVYHVSNPTLYDAHSSTVPSIPDVNNINRYHSWDSTDVEGVIVVHKKWATNSEFETINTNLVDASKNAPVEAISLNGATKIHTGGQYCPVGSF